MRLVCSLLISSVLGCAVSSSNSNEKNVEVSKVIKIEPTQQASWGIIRQVLHYQDLLNNRTLALVECYDKYILLDSIDSKNGNFSKPGQIVHLRTSEQQPISVNFLHEAALFFMDKQEVEFWLNGSQLFFGLRDFPEMVKSLEKHQTKTGYWCWHEVLISIVIEK